MSISKLAGRLVHGGGQRGDAQMTFALGKGEQDKRNGDCMDLVLTWGIASKF